MGKESTPPLGGRVGPRPPPDEGRASERLDSWKEIAAYLKRDIRTLHRWEKTEHLPVHRHPHQKRGTVYAFKAELDTWWNDGHSRLELQPEGALPWMQTSRRKFLVAGMLAVLVAGLALNLRWVRGRLLREPAPLLVRSLAVLPLTNLSGDPQQDYFADGMTEALITNLGKISALRVISRTSVMRYKQTRKPLPEIARELGVDALVEGTVMRSGDRVRITANLLHAGTDRHLWAETYERDLRDVLALQAEVAGAIVDEIKIKVTPLEQARLASARPVNPEAYEAYLKGRSTLEGWTEDHCWTSIKWFEKAIERDPTYAAPYAGQADAYYVLAYLNFRPPREAFSRAKEAAAKALAWDANSAEAYASLCYIRTLFDWDWQAAQRDCTQAIELNPNSAYAQHAYSHYLWAVGRMEESLAVSKRYIELDPLTPTPYSHMGSQYYLSRRNDESIEYFQKALALDPNYPEALAGLAGPYLAKRMNREAIATLQKALTLSRDNPLYLGNLGYAYARAGATDQAIKVLDELKRLSKRKFVGSFAFALVYGGLGDKDQAFQWLNKALEERNIELAYAKMEPHYDLLRSDPRFQDLLRRMNFPR
jgi:TolB-like protein/Tfp pilus assembly protein PilF